jgi:hypothetical protein
MIRSLRRSLAKGRYQKDLEKKFEQHVTTYGVGGRLLDYSELNKNLEAGFIIMPKRRTKTREIRVASATIILISLVSVAALLGFAAVAEAGARCI